MRISDQELQKIVLKEFKKLTLIEQKEGEEPTSELYDSAINEILERISEARSTAESVLAEPDVQETLRGIEDFFQIVLYIPVKTTNLILEGLRKLGLEVSPSIKDMVNEIYVQGEITDKIAERRFVETLYSVVKYLQYVYTIESADLEKLAKFEGSERALFEKLLERMEKKSPKALSGVRRNAMKIFGVRSVTRGRTAAATALGNLLRGSRALKVFVKERLGISDISIRKQFERAKIAEITPRSRYQELLKETNIKGQKRKAKELLRNIKNISSQEGQILRNIAKGEEVDKNIFKLMFKDAKLTRTIEAYIPKPNAVLTVTTEVRGGARIRRRQYNPSDLIKLKFKIIELPAQTQGQAPKRLILEMTPDGGAQVIGSMHYTGTSYSIKDLTPAQVVDKLGEFSAARLQGGAGSVDKLISEQMVDQFSTSKNRAFSSEAAQALNEIVGDSQNVSALRPDSALSSFKNTINSRLQNVSIRNQRRIMLSVLNYEFLKENALDLDSAPEKQHFGFNYDVGDENIGSIREQHVTDKRRKQIQRQNKKFKNDYPNSDLDQTYASRGSSEAELAEFFDSKEFDEAIREQIRSMPENERAALLAIYEEARNPEKGFLSSEKVAEVTKNPSAHGIKIASTADVVIVREAAENAMQLLARAKVLSRSIEKALESLPANEGSGKLQRMLFDLGLREGSNLKALILLQLAFDEFKNENLEPKIIASITKDIRKALKSTQIQNALSDLELDDATRLQVLAELEEMVDQIEKTADLDEYFTSIRNITSNAAVTGGKVLVAAARTFTLAFEIVAINAVAANIVDSYNVPKVKNTSGLGQAGFTTQVGIISVAAYGLPLLAGLFATTGPQLVGAVALAVTSEITQEALFYKMGLPSRRKYSDMTCGAARRRAKSVGKQEINLSSGKTIVISQPAAAPSCYGFEARRLTKDQVEQKLLELGDKSSEPLDFYISTTSIADEVDYGEEIYNNIHAFIYKRINESLVKPELNKEYDQVWQDFNFQKIVNPNPRQQWRSTIQQHGFGVRDNTSANLKVIANEGWPGLYYNHIFTRKKDGKEIQYKARKSTLLISKINNKTGNDAGSMIGWLDEDGVPLKLDPKSEFVIVLNDYLESRTRFSGLVALESERKIFVKQGAKQNENVANAIRARLLSPVDIGIGGDSSEVLTNLLIKHIRDGEESDGVSGIYKSLKEPVAGLGLSPNYIFSELLLRGTTLKGIQKIKFDPKSIDKNYYEESDLDKLFKTDLIFNHWIARAGEKAFNLNYRESLNNFLKKLEGAPGDQVRDYTTTTAGKKIAGEKIIDAAFSTMEEYAALNETLAKLIDIWNKSLDHRRDTNKNYKRIQLLFAELQQKYGQKQFDGSFAINSLVIKQIGGVNLQLPEEQRAQLNAARQATEKAAQDAEDKERRQKAMKTPAVKPSPVN